MWDMLGQVPGILDVPRASIYAGMDSIARRLGYRGPSINNFSDILVNGLGADPNSNATSILGMIGDIATDPLSYAGYPFARGMQKLFFETMKGAIKNPGSSTMFFRSAPKSGMLDSLSNTLFVDDARVIKKPYWGPQYRDPDMISTDDVTRLVINPGREAGSVDILEGRVRLPRQVGYKGDPAEFLNRTGTVGNRELWKLDSPYYRLLGYFEPEANALFVKANTGFGDYTRRHETIHAILSNAARDQQSISNLPPSLRIAANLLSSENPSLKTAGLIMDEALATAGGARSLWKRMGSLGSFLFSPEHNMPYYEQFKASPSFLDKRLVEIYGKLPDYFVKGNMAAAPFVTQGLHSIYGTDRSLYERLSFSPADRHVDE